MKKLKLNLAELRVESFTAESGSGQGTVVALSETGPSDCLSGCHYTCLNNMTCNGPGICFPDSGICGSGIDGC
jgi:hypothetical protein